MEKLFEKLFEIKKIQTKFIFVVWASSIIILFSPEKLISKLKLQGFIDSYGKFVGISFIICTAFLLIVSISELAKWINRRRWEKKMQKKILTNLAKLDPHEKSLIREFFINNSDTLQFPIDNPTVVGLTNKSIIYQASSTGFTYVHGAYFPYSITTFARENIRNDTIDWPSEMSKESQKTIMNSRPDWARENSQFDDLINGLRSI